MKKWSTGKKSTACCSINQVNNKGPWTEQEDKKLINLVEKYGAEKWSFISSHFPERIGKQCRERWFNHLCPTVNKTAWSKEEEWILFILHNQIGNKWSQLCKYLPGRTDNTIKNHWNSTMKKRIEQLQGEYDNMIRGKTQEEINKIQEDILEKYKVVVEQENKKFYDEKMKNYEKFKNITIDNKQSMYKLKKILLFRTHSKKLKKRGRKKKYNKIEDDIIENNKNLFEKAKNLSLQDLLFTSPITIKRVKIPGFTKDESLIFDISYNRSFTKNCYNHKRKLNEEIELDLIKKEKERENKEEEKKKSNEEEKKITKYQKMEIKNIDENIEELKTDRTTIEIEYIGNKEGISMEKSLPINREIIKDIIENKIEVESNETFRFIYTKTLADIIESITALCYNTSLFNNFSIEESFNFTSIFLKESNILISEYKENISKITENSIKNLLNPKCKFKENQRDKFFEVILENKKYNFKKKSKEQEEKNKKDGETNSSMSVKLSSEHTTKRKRGCCN